MQAALATGVATTLADPAGRFTLFAPNDRAFMRLVADLSGTHPASEAEALNTAVAALGVDKIKNVSSTTRSPARCSTRSRCSCRGR